jgi:hypothetical protein
MKKALGTKKKIPRLLTAQTAHLGLSPLLLLLNAPTEKHFLSKCEFLMVRIGSGRAAWRLRGEIIGDLEDLIERRNKSRVFNALLKLVSKVNRIGMKPSWFVWPTKPVGHRLLDSIVGENQFNYLLSKLGPEQAILKLGKVECMVAMVFRHVFDARRFFYGMVINALQNGAIEYLCRCSFKKCRLFFVTHDRRKRSFCCDKCQKGAQNEDSRQRMEIWRKFKKNEN